MPSERRLTEILKRNPESVPVFEPGPNPVNGLQVCIYKLVNSSVFSSP